MSHVQLQPIAERVFLLSGDTHPKICSNVYVLEGPDSLALIDSGVDADRVQSAIVPLHKPIEIVFFTHGHFDHVQAATKAGWKGSMAKEDLDVIDQLNAAWVKVKKPDFFTPFSAHTVQFAGVHLQIIPTPGHTPRFRIVFRRQARHPVFRRLQVCQRRRGADRPLGRQSDRLE